MTLKGFGMSLIDFLMTKEGFGLLDGNTQCSIPILRGVGGVVW